MTWVKTNGKILKRDGKIAVSLTCCCECGCSPEPTGDLIAIFRADGADCSEWEGLEVPLLAPGGGGIWISDGAIPEWSGIQGWHDTELILECIPNNNVNPSDPEAPCMDYVFRFRNECRNAAYEYVPLASCSCDPFEFVTGTIFQLTGGQCCELCSCDFGAATTFHWEIIEAPP